MHISAELVVKEVRLYVSAQPVTGTPNTLEYETPMLPALPKEYFEYIRANGLFEGYTSDEADPGYVELWAAEAIPSNNCDLEIEMLAPGFIAFAGNGGGEVLAFDATGIVYMLPMVGMASDCAIQVANNFHELKKRFVR